MMSLITCNFKIDNSIDYSFATDWAMISLVASHKRTAGFFCLFRCLGFFTLVPSY